jgi:hypothetical protein
MDGGRVPRSSGDVRGSSDGWVRLGRCLKRGGFTPAQLDGVFVFVSDLGRSYPIQLILLFERIVPQVSTAVRDRCKLLCASARGANPPAFSNCSQFNGWRACSMTQYEELRSAACRSQWEARESTLSGLPILEPQVIQWARKSGASCAQGKSRNAK